MKKGKRTTLIETLYKGEIKQYGYKTYIGSLGVPCVTTYVVLNDGFDTQIKLEELGVMSENLINDLEKNGYISLDSSLKLKKQA